MNFVNDRKKTIGKEQLHLTPYTTYVKIIFCCLKSIVHSGVPRIFEKKGGHTTTTKYA